MKTGLDGESMTCCTIERTISSHPQKFGPSAGTSSVQGRQWKKTEQRNESLEERLTKRMMIKPEKQRRLQLKKVDKME